jgi:hypothetical protein
MKTAVINQFKKLEPFVRKGAELHTKHQKKFGLGGFAIGGTLGYFQHDYSDDLLTPCKRRVKIFENMYMAGLVGGVACAFPIELALSAAAGVTILAGLGILAAPVSIANELCNKNE